MIMVPCMVGPHWTCDRYYIDVVTKQEYVCNCHCHTQQTDSLITILLEEHKIHPTERFTASCRVCISNYAHHIQMEDKFSKQCRKGLEDIALTTINKAIADVITALGNDHEPKIRPFKCKLEAR